MKIIVVLEIHAVETTGYKASDHGFMYRIMQLPSRRNVVKLLCLHSHGEISGPTGCRECTALKS